MRVGTCKLCQRIGELQDSHFMSKGIFAQLRTPTAKNPHPVLMTPQVSVISSQQLRDYAFCSDCEQRFNRNGESWVLANMARMNGFKLQDALIQAGPVVVHPTIALYAGAAIPSIDMDALVYFAMSIFWRAAVQEWKSIDGLTTRLDLDGHEEEIREFLLGGVAEPAGTASSAYPARGTSGRLQGVRLPGPWHRIPPPARHRHSRRSTSVLRPNKSGAVRRSDHDVG